MLDHSASLDLILSALADPTRRAIIERLTLGPAPVKGIAERVPMSLQGVMQHLAVLEAATLVRSQKAGRVRTMSLNPAALRQLEQWIVAQRVAWERKFDRLGQILQDK